MQKPVLRLVVLLAIEPNPNESSLLTAYKLMWGAPQPPTNACRLGNQLYIAIECDGDDAELSRARLEANEGIAEVRIERFSLKQAA